MFSLRAHRPLSIQTYLLWTSANFRESTHMSERLTAAQDMLVNPNGSTAIKLLVFWSSILVHWFVPQPVHFCAKFRLNLKWIFIYWLALFTVVILNTTTVIPIKALDIFWGKAHQLLQILGLVHHSKSLQFSERFFYLLSFKYEYFIKSKRRILICCFCWLKLSRLSSILGILFVRNPYQYYWTITSILSELVGLGYQESIALKPKSKHKERWITSFCASLFEASSFGIPHLLATHPLTFTSCYISSCVHVVFWLLKIILLVMVGVILRNVHFSFNGTSWL